MPYPSQVFQMRMHERLEDLFLATLEETISPRVLKLPENRPLIKKERHMRMGRTYSPTCDIAIGPFSFRQRQKYDPIYLELAKLSEIATFLANVEEKSLRFSDNDPLSYNENPRCFVSIEIENTTAQDVKHLLGSVMNCSLMGKIGIVVVFEDYFEYAQRLIMYIGYVERKKKTMEKLFRNVFMVSKSDMGEILQIDQP